MKENNNHSGAEAQEQNFLEKNLKKGRIKVFFEANLNPPLSGTFKHHIHSDVVVPWWVLRQWRKRGFKPLKRSIAHVRFEDSDKKYTFPAYFWNRWKVMPGAGL